LLALWVRPLGRKQRGETVAGLLLVWGGAELLNSTLKHLVRRPRPEPVESIMLGQQYAFPSGHAMVAASFYGFLAHRCWRILHGWQRVAGAVGSLLLILLIGLSRLYLGIHYITDVVAGYMAGVLWTGAIIYGRHRLTRKRRSARIVGMRQLRPLHVRGGRRARADRCVPPALASVRWPPFVAAPLLAFVALFTLLGDESQAPRR
jgi:membrane-associated phospholipid phosphatase